MRLIDADELLEQIKKWQKKHKYYDNPTNICDIEDSAIYMTLEGIQSLIDEQITTFDLDKIVEELDNASYFTMSTFDEDGYSNDDSENVIDLYRAIEVVKKFSKSTTQ